MKLFCLHKWNVVEHMGHTRFVLHRCCSKCNKNQHESVYPYRFWYSVVCLQLL